MKPRHYTPADQLLMNVDQALRTLFGPTQTTGRKNPSVEFEEIELTEAEKDKTSRLMRINHTGEICAQALYQGQALTAKSDDIKRSMQESADEENDHLDWCETRINELDGRTSLLNPFWFASSYLMGAAAGLAGDKWSLGFVAETEKQVEKHLDAHLNEIPEEDKKSRAVLEQMRIDEIEHGNKAKQLGAAVLPKPVKAAMALTSKIMTGSVYYL